MERVWPLESDRPGFKYHFYDLEAMSLEWLGQREAEGILSARQRVINH